jgi:hypothetical protein
MTSERARRWLTERIATAEHAAGRLSREDRRRSGAAEETRVTDLARVTETAAVLRYLYTLVETAEESARMHRATESLFAELEKTDPKKRTGHLNTRARDLAKRLSGAVAQADGGEG